MAKRFISPDWKQLRKLPEHLQRAWFYLWDKADACGVYHYDPDYLKLDLSLEHTPTINELFAVPNCQLLSGDRLLLTDFLQVNYGTLKQNYNPHKPVFRALEKNNLKLDSSLIQACAKLEDEEEDKEVLEGGTGETKKVLPFLPEYVETEIPAVGLATEFDKFWKLYGKDVAMYKCQHVWQDMTQQERAKAVESAPLYVASLTHPKYHMHPLKWLEEKHYNVNYNAPPANTVRVINCMTGVPVDMPIADWERHKNDSNTVFQLVRQ